MGRTFFPPQATRRRLNLKGRGVSNFPRRGRAKTRRITSFMAGSIGARNAGRNDRRSFYWMALFPSLIVPRFHGLPAGSIGQDLTWPHWSPPTIFNAVGADPLKRIVWILRGLWHRTSPRFAR